MRKIIVFAGAFLLFAATAAFSAPTEVTIINSTGYEFSAVYVAPADNGEWGEDLLGGGPLKDGEQKTFSLENLDLSEDQFNFDVRAVDVDGDEYAKYDISLREDSSVTLTFEDYVEAKTDNGGSADRYDEGYNAGYDEGFKKGQQEGFKEGYGQGFKDGYKEGPGKRK